VLIDPVNARELVIIARELGADVLSGALRYPSDTEGWLVGGTTPESTNE
jgi:hypothetical protein